MFGSKLRSWMENHIVRPRKKGSKSKTGSSGSNFGVLTAQNGYSKSGTFTGDSTVGSPARRSEVSPIQNHTTSRRGWHSPNQDSVPISPKSDHYPLQHRLPNNHGQPTGGGAHFDHFDRHHAYGTLNGVDHSSASHYQPSNHQQQQQQHSVLSSPRSISRNGSSYTLEPAPPVNVYYSKSVDSFAASDGATVPYAMPEFDFRSESGNGPSSIMTGGSGGGGGGVGGSMAISGGHQLVVASHSNNTTYSMTATSSSSELLEELHDAGGRAKRMQHPAATAARISSSSSSSVNSSNHHHHHQHNVNNHFNNNHMVNGSLSHYTPRGSHSPATPMASVSTEPKYGKLLPQQPMATQYGDHRPIYYDHPQQQQQQHNGINNNLVYSTSPHPTRANASGQTPPPPPVRYTPPLQRAAHPGHPAANGNRIINGNNNNNNNNNNHLEVVVGGGGGGSGRAPNNHSGAGTSSFTASFANKFHKLTGTGSRATHDHTVTVNGGAGSGASEAGVGVGKLNHVNNNNGLATSNGGHKLTNGGSSNTSAVVGPPYQINNVSSTHLHPAHHHHHQQAPSSSSSSSSPPPSAAAAPPTAASQGQGSQTQHLHHPAHGQPHHHHHHPHPHGHTVGHTLSSPESAYSTGYSTDGTSPGGCSYTPEYYINIRTGTHYFAKGTTLPGRGPGVVAAAAAGAAGTGAGCTDGGTKFKCALNRIEEKHVEFCVEQEKQDSPRRTGTTAPVSVNLSANLKPTSPGLGACALSQTQQQQQQQQQQQSSTGTTQPQASLATSTSQTAAAAAPCSTAAPQPTPNAVAMSPIMQKNLGMQHYRSIESPSPRQRCRIRTNPWLTTADGALASNGIKRTDQDSGSTSSGIKSSSGTDDNKHDNKKPNANSDTDSSSSTEKIVNKRILTPRSLKKIGDIGTRLVDSKTISVTFGSNQESDEDATLNEMMGKFDESYHYEKETDILSCSDSDPTDCPTDIDTGQDAGDECDTDDLLDLDFIDTGSVLEDKETFRHTASCSIHSFTPDGSNRPSGVGKQRSLRNKRSNESGAGSKRRKKLVRTRKKQSESVTTEMGANGNASSCGLVSRGCRSLGGTPMSLRRNQRQEAECRTPVARSSPLTNRCNSLTFTEVNTLHSRILAISESEKALLRADLEADVKYKQLIHEAESILFSMKSNSSICLKEQTVTVASGQPPPLPPREPLPPVAPPAVPAKEVTPQTTIASPRRVCNPPANKRVEMLRNCEADLRRELAKTCSQKCADGAGVGHPVSELNPAEGVIVNKRLEVLRYDTSPCSLSAPNSPKNTRVLLPRKTHISSFMHHQQSSSNGRQAEHANDLKHCANGASMVAPPPPPPRLLSKSPTIMRRRFRSQSPHLNIESDSDSDDVIRNLDSKANGNKGRSNKENHMNPQHPPPGKGSVTGKQMNNFRHTIHGGGAAAGDGAAPVVPGELHLELNGGMHKSPLISFRSVDIGSPVTDDSYCPQSEPLKRKIYTCSAAFERIQRTLDQDPELSKKALLERITLLRRDRQAMKSPRHEPPVDREKNELIMDTLAEIKRIFEDQSIELNQLNDSDN